MMNDALTDTDLKILETAVVCRKAGAARYIWPERVETLIGAGLLAIRNEHAATITDAGLARFLQPR